VRRRTVLRAAALGGAAATGALALAPAGASAHGIVQRADVPIPEAVFAWGAAGILVISFIILALFWPEPKLEGDSWRPIGKGDPHGAQPAFWLVIDGFCGLVGVLLLALVLWAGFDGVNTPAANITPTFVYVIFWNGLVLASIFFGDVFRAFNPWRAAAKAFAWVAGAIARGPLPEPLRYPDRLGRMPAAVGLAAFAALELVVEDYNLPRTVATAAVIYSVVTWIGMALYGIDRWLDRGESFNVYFNLFSRVSPLERREGILGVRKPLSALTKVNPLPGTVAFVAVMIGGVTFDGFKEGPVFTDLTPHLSDFWHSIGFDLKHSLELANLVGLIGAIAIVWGFYELGSYGAKTVGGGFTRDELARKFVHSLVPIAFAYVAAHYMTQLLFQGQAMAYLGSDPLGRGWDIFGGRDRGIDYGVIGATATWYWQVGFVVVGHVAALVLAHDRALVTYKDAREAVRSQYWMLGVMVGFTSLALWLLSQANV
jgi:hypothetical protein